MRNLIIKTENLTHIYSPGTPFEHSAIKNVNLEIERGEFIGVIGHTGSGKSTLIQHLNGLLKPDSGRVLFNGEDIWADKKKLRGVRFKVGLVFQYPEYQLFEETVYKDIAFGPINMGLPADEIKDRVYRALSFVGLDEAVLDKSPFEISGGQKRRVAIAGVIAMEPEVLILDEPTAGLDPKGRDSILSHIKDYHSANNSTVILISHSMEDMARLAGRLIVLEKGTIAMNGTPHEIFSEAERIRAMGLEVPQVTAVFIRLRELGLKVDSSVYTVEQAKAAILRLKGGRSGA